jgi:DNA-binding NarL/FixJ family response regulator
MKRIRVLLADDHPLVEAGFRSLLEAECEVVGVVSNGRSLVESVSRLKQEIIVTDIS